MSNPVAPPPARLDLPVEVIGADVHGQQFLESTRTLTIHRAGVSIALPYKLAPDSELIVRNPENNEEANALVVGQTPGGAAGDVYGLAFLDPSTDLWHIHFRTTGPTRIVHLECTGCHSVCTLSLSDEDLEIFAATGEMIRPCKQCKSSGVWKETSLAVRTRKSGASSGRSATEERRTNRRTAMKTAACVRFSGVDVVVDCEDVSKGGFRFTSRKEYPQGTRIEAAVPYTKSSTNIFCPAGITYCQKMPDGRFRHGVTYIQRRTSPGWDP